MNQLGHKSAKAARQIIVIACSLAMLSAKTSAQDQVTVRRQDLLSKIRAGAATNQSAVKQAIATEAPSESIPDFDSIDEPVAACNCELETHTASSCRKCNDSFSVHNSNLTFGGWIQQGVTFNPANPDNRLNAPVLFNERSNDYELNQLYMFLGKDAIADRNGWDWGGRVDLNYGTDSRFVTVPGLEENPDRTPRWNTTNSDYGLALPQAYAELATPFGPHGSIIRAGHFYTLAGYESFAAPNNFFYSHSYSFLYGQPFTQTGVRWSAKSNPTTTWVVAGTTGWDSFVSDGDTWAIQAALTKKLNGGRTSVSLTTLAGRDFTGITTAGGPLDEPRVWTSALLKHNFNPCFYYVLEADYGRQDDGVVILDPSNRTIGFDAGQWWGISQYMVYQYNEKLSTGMRVEWFRDEGNSRVGVPIEYSDGSPAFNGNDYFEITAGWNFKPIPDFLFRNEIRWDYSDVESNPNVPGGVAGVRPYDDRSKDNQLTIAFDLILFF